MRISVFVAFTSIEYEGCTEPEGVGLTAEAAEAQNGWSMGGRCVKEFELDVPALSPLPPSPASSTFGRGHKLRRRL